MTKLLTLTHFGGLKIRVNPEHITALIPDGVLRGIDSKGTDSQTKCAVVVGASAYHVRETVAAVAALVEGTELKVVGNSQ